jgi:arginase family enzyme
MSDFLVSILKTCPNSFPVNLGGDHSMGEAVTFALHKLGKFKNAAFLHIDAHPDLIPARFGIEHCFTTWVYNSLPFLKNTEQCVQVGIRQTKISKEDWYKKTGVHQYWQKDLKKLSPKKLFSILNEHWKKLGCQSLYISFDIDALDPKFAPSTGTPEKNGMTLNYATELLKLCKKHWPLIAFDLVEVAPVLGSALSHKRTLSSAVAILESILLGQVLNKNLKSS